MSAYNIFCIVFFPPITSSYVCVCPSCVSNRDIIYIGKYMYIPQMCPNLDSVFINLSEIKGSVAFKNQENNFRSR
jgi:hypothetical protein